MSSPVLALAGNSKPKPNVERIILWEHLWNERERELIKMLLDPTIDTYGPYELIKSIPMEQGRAIVSLMKNDLINILTLPTSREREERLSPLYIYMGDADLGYRVCLIKKGTQHLFNT